MQPIDYVLVFSAAAGITNYAKTHLNLSGGYLQLFGGLVAVVLLGLAASPTIWPEMEGPSQLILWVVTGGAFPGTVGTGFQLAQKVGQK